MKKKYLCVIAILIVSFDNNLMAQSKFNNCSAIFLNQKMVVNDYSPEGKCVVSEASKGKLTVSTATFDNNQWYAGDKIAFKITIRDGKTKTLWSYSDKTFKEIDMEKVLSKCQKGDYILVSVIEDQYSLPHNEILVE